ncbi:MAG TPA: beta-galactosidase [Puia sp.]|nr:beta-galactosidase [Puia sp.]
MRSILVLALCCLMAGAGETQPLFDTPGANDHIFPAAARAKPFIDFDARGFLVGGKRTFLVSAGMEYARVPHELWEDRLLRLKRAGFNCIEIYTFWNFHEPREGQFDFSGDHDLEAFLRLVRHMGLYAIVRVGPYYCAEWDNGGYPLWLRFKPGVRVREDNAAFLQYVDRYFDRLFPIVDRQQIHHGGAVILVQLENEHPKGWGTVMPDGYFRHLREKALSLGLEVPYFFSGLHHASDPAGERPSVLAGAGVDKEGTTGRKGVAGGLMSDPAALDDPARPNPWLSTEFWSVWYSGYGSTDKDARVYERRTWKILAHGGNGYNYYMAHGGSNFDYTNNDEDAASYDYGAAVGQAGDLRPIYYSFSRMGWWARSFADVLENSEDATATERQFFHDMDTPLIVTARHSPAGKLIFLDNPSAQPVKTAIAGVGSVVLSPGEIFPIVYHFALDSAVTLEWAPVRVLGISRQGAITTMVIYGAPGSEAEMTFTIRGKVTILQGSGEKASKTAGEGLMTGREISGHQQLLLHTNFSASNRPSEYVFRAGGQKWRILAVNTSLADRTWFVESAGRNYVVCGPAYVGEVSMQDKKLSMITETYLKDSLKYPVVCYGEDRVEVRPKTKGPAGMAAQLPLSGWQFRTGVHPAAPGYYDHDWKASKQPLQMGADGDATADAWYRTNLSIDTAGLYTLQVEGGDRAIAFVDGKPAGTGNIRDGEMTFDLSKGAHTLAFFTAHDGRDKLAAYLGAMDSVDRKGLFGKAVLRRGGPSIVTLGGWHFEKASVRDSGREPAGGQEPGTLPERLIRNFPKQGVAGWSDYTIGQDAFGGKEGYGWFRTILAEPGPGVSEIVLAFRSVDENATVFINGHRIARHEGWNQPFEVVIGGLDTLQRPLELTLFMENYSNEGGIDKPVRANYAGPGKELTGWSMRGGIGGPIEEAWKPLRTGARGATAGGPTGQKAEPGPCFYRCPFTAPAYTIPGPHPIWRVHTDGLGHGSVWVNGHNLGRYPEKINAPGLYIPECWLKAGRNTLMIFEEDGKDPGQVSIQAEKAAGREKIIFSNF